LAALNKREARDIIGLERLQLRFRNNMQERRIMPPGEEEASEENL
jgi:hypothetical protein